MAGSRILFCALVLAVTVLAAEEAASEEPPFVLPPLHYSTHHSFRGVGQDGKIEGYDISGHSTSIPGVHDYLRLVPANPLAIGAAFTQVPMMAEEWVTEIAFRVHGPPAVGHVDVGEDGKPRKVHKGGRGLAFWFSKTQNPGSVTLSHDPKWPARPPPPAIPEDNDPSDDKVSLFGYHTKFDGLGVIFDTAPQSPLHKRSDKRYWTGDQAAAVGVSGVISGILDDGSGNWLDPDGKNLGPEEEANYLDRAIGECEAAFRNAQGLLWTRISYINNTIRVDLDLAPHTTLAKAGRDYAHNCFTLSGLSLNTGGSYIGVTGLASGNPEPDFIDIYAMDVFEVVKVEPGKTIPAEGAPSEKMSNAPLEGTVDDAVTTVAHEMFLSQAKMMEAIDGLARRFDALSRTLAISGATGGQAESGGSGSGTFSPAIMARLASMESMLQRLESAGGVPAASTGGSGGDGESITHILQLQDKLMVELKAFGRKLDTSSGQSTASLGTLASRSAESLQLLQRATASMDEISKSSGGSGWLVWVMGAIIVGGGLAWMRERREGWGGGRGKKMI